MRLFIVSYPKSGTHQIVPMFLVIPDVVDRSAGEYINVPKRYGLNTEVNQDGVQETLGNLRTFKRNSSRGFGHLSYIPEYAKLFQQTDTKVLFNIRDPRDVIVAEYENAQRKFRRGDSMPLYNFYDAEKEEFLYRQDDPITELIYFSAARWPRWLGWLDHDFVFPVKYENLRLNTRKTVKEIIAWLQGRECNNLEHMIKMTEPTSGNPTFRRGVPGEWKTKFEPHHKELADELLGDTIKRMGYE